jgi:hypothetical protein
MMLKKSRSSSTGFKIKQPLITLSKMKLDVLKPIDVERAAANIDAEGIPKNNVWIQHYFTVNGKEYPFKHLAYTALELIGITDIKFESNDSYRNYFAQVLGFKMTYYEGGYNFFTKQELEYYASIVRKPYRKDNPEHQVYPNKLNALIAKTNFWAQQLVHGEYLFKPDRSWITSRTANIKPYLWPRIYKGEDRDIFFNVEVNGDDRFIGYKLDGYYETTKQMRPDQIETLNEFKQEIEWEWPHIDFENIGNYDWDRLIGETMAYIKKYEAYYELLRKRLYKETKLARIAWNTNGWVVPSGREGKGLSPSFEKEHGFGHEEWLFNSDMVIGQYKYGFLEPIHKFKSKYIGKVFDLSLFTRNSVDGKEYWVATLKNVEVIQLEEAAEVQKQVELRGWHGQMKADLNNLSLDGKNLDKWVKKDSSALINIKFTSAQLNSLPTELLEIDDPGDIPADHYVLYDLKATVREKYTDKGGRPFDFDASGSTHADLKKKGKRKSFTVEREMELRHNELQEKLLHHLQGQYSEKMVKRECNTFGCRIDLTRKTETGYVFYEIKTYNNLMTSIRLSLGQLLEYSLYPNGQQAEKLVLVSDQLASEEVHNYILHLKTFLKLDFSYMHFDVKTSSIVSEI